jgi:predicted HAD superfamily Cof-like phosphohydrolase
MTNAEMVKQFHDKLDQEIPESPYFPELEVCALRMDLIREEKIEFEQAVYDGDLVGVADALADLLYVTYGAALAFGIPIDKIFAEVHRSNMTKFKHGPQFREDGKLLKGDGFEPPRIKEILDEHHH